MSTPRIGLRAMLRDGVASVRRYTGTVLTLYLAQALLVGVAIVGVATVLAAEFARQPMFDQAVDGDLVSLVTVVRAAPNVLWACAAVVVTVVLSWTLLSWWLTGGLLAVLADEPDGRAATARSFGSGAADMFLAFVRVGVLSAMAHVLVLAVVTLSLGAMTTRLDVALSDADLLAALAIGLGPPLLARMLVVTIADYARAILVDQRASDKRRAIRAYVRAMRLVVMRPAALLHALVCTVLQLAVVLTYAWLAAGHPLFGAGGALTLLIIRQGVALLRMVLTVAAIKGQLLLAQTLPPA